MLVLREIQRGKLPEDLARSFIADLGCFLGGIEAAKTTLLAGDLDVSFPFSALLIPGDAPVSGGIAATRAGVRILLGLCRRAKVAPSIVQSIAIDMVGSLSGWRLENEAVHVDRSPVLLAGRIEAARLGFDGTPSAIRNQREVNGINDRVFALGKRDEDTILLHSVLLTLSAMPGAVCAVARRFIDFPNFSMVTPLLGEW